MTTLSNAYELSKTTLAGFKRIQEVEIRLEMMEKMLQLQETIQLAKQDVFSLQDAYMEACNENKKLRKEKAEWQQHLKDAEAYELRQLAPNVYAYVKREAGKDLCNEQKLCQPCFEKGVKSYFNFDKSDFGYDTLSCHACGLTIRIPNDIKAECLTISEPHRFDGF